MWSRTVVFGVFLTLLADYQALGQVTDYGACRNPRGQEGRCIPIRSCEPLINFLTKTNGREGTQFLRDSVCVYEGSNPIVCCPDQFDYDDNSNNGNNNNANNNNNNNNNFNGNPFLNNQPKTPTYGPLYPPVCGYVDATYTRVVNGVPAALGAWPWAALLGYRSKRDPSKPNFRCGGALISARHVLTAGHCVHGQDGLFLVRLGELDLDDDNDGATPIDLLIEKKTIHPQYNAKSVSNDIAVLKFERDVQFTDLIKPICLPVTQDIRQRKLANSWPYIVGWGALGYRRASASKLQQVQLPIVEQNQCKAAYTGRGVFIDDRVLCAGYTDGGKDACQGDSGGPMMYPIVKTWYSIGVISFGINCALPNYPGVYTKTEYFLDFILDNLN